MLLSFSTCVQFSTTRNEMRYCLIQFFYLISIVYYTGTITYSFVSAPDEKLKFEINNKTGVIRTTQMLDRDEPAREKEAYLTILATDNGRPQLDDVCTFKVTIEDVNDNSPVFDKVVRISKLSIQLT